MKRFEMEIHDTNFRSGGMAFAHSYFDRAFQWPHRSIDTQGFIFHIALAAACVDVCHTKAVVKYEQLILVYIELNAINV